HLSIGGAQGVDGSETTDNLHSAVQESHIGQLLADGVRNTTEGVVGTESGAKNGAHKTAHEAVANNLDDVDAEGAPVLAGHDSGQNVSDHAAASDISQLILCH